jgi:hypothetical protein
MTWAEIYITAISIAIPLTLVACYLVDRYIFNKEK